ncbi:MAG: hypothetical protein ABIR83_07360 [Nakamurella sp.]
MVTVRQRSRRPAGRRVAAAAVGLLLLAGCGGQVGAAAVVGAGSVSSASIEAQRSALTSATTPSSGAGELLSADRATQAGQVAQDRTLVTYAIWHEQLRQAGTPVPLTEAEINSILADTATTDQITQLLLATPDTLRDRLTDTATLQRMVSDAVTAGTPVSGPSVDYELINVDSLEIALAARSRYTADPGSWATDLAAAGSDRGSSGSASAAGPGAALIPTGVYSAGVGDFIVVPAGNSTATIVRITAHSMSSAPLDVSTLQQAGPAVVNAIGAMLLNQTTGAAVPPVEVNPRFGVWDPAVAQVVPAPAQL